MKNGDVRWIKSDGGWKQKRTEDEVQIQQLLMSAS